MTFSDEILMAYADNELDAETRAAVEIAMQSDGEIARRIARHQALRTQLRAAFDPTLDEPVPERLVAAARADAEHSSSKVGDLSAARTARFPSTRRHWSWPEWGSMAATLVVGVLLGQALLLRGAPDQIVAHDGRLIAQGTLADALTHELASAPDPAASVKIGVSFLAATGNYCRTFVMRGKNALGGLACRNGDAWDVQALSPIQSAASSTEAAQGYRTAGTEIPRAILIAVDEQIVGEPLDAAGEAAARNKDWR